MAGYIIIEGNVVDGFTFYGPFETNDAAIEAADLNLNSQEWVLAPLSSLEQDDANEPSDIPL